MLTVSGPTTFSTYIRSGYCGFFVEVEAHSGRWTAPPFALTGGERVAVEDLLELLVGELEICDSGLAKQRLELFAFAYAVLQKLVDGGVDAADEDRVDRTDCVDRFALGNAPLRDP